MPRNADELVALLDLETIDDDLFRGAADADRAAARLRWPGGRPGAGRGRRGPSTRRTSSTRCTPTSCSPATPRPRPSTTSSNLRDGRSFATRRVLGAPARTADLRDDRQLPARRGGLRPPGADARRCPGRTRPDPPGAVAPTATSTEWDVVDLRYVGSSGDGGPDGRRRTRRGSGSGCGSPTPLPDDPFLHVAAFTYALRHDADGRGRSRRTACPLRRPARRSSPRSTTRSGSTGPSAPTSGGSTTRSRRRPRARRGLVLGPGLHPGRHARRHRRPGGPDAAGCGPRKGAARVSCHRGAGRPARPRGTSTSTSSAAGPARLAPPAGLRRPGRRAGAHRGHPHRGPGVRRALAALLLPAARRLRGADRLRRRADPRRPLLPDPPGGGPPARPADLLPDRSTSSGPRRASSTRT